MIGEGQNFIADDLTGFVAFAGDDQHVALAQHRDAGADRLRTVANLARTGCDWLAAIQSHDPQDAANRLGMMASVIESGDICVGAPVAVIHTPEVAAH